jgi:hypothetical protein
MTVTAEHLAEIRSLCASATPMAEGGTEFISLAALNILVANQVVTCDALLSLGPHTGYSSRLYLSAPIPQRGQNWTTHVVLGRSWNTPSWNGVQTGRPAEMLLQHLETYR